MHAVKMKHAAVLDVVPICLVANGNLNLVSLPNADDVEKQNTVQRLANPRLGLTDIVGGA